MDGCCARVLLCQLQSFFVIDELARRCCLPYNLISFSYKIENIAIADIFYFINMLSELCRKTETMFIVMTRNKAGNTAESVPCCWAESVPCCWAGAVKWNHPENAEKANASSTNLPTDRHRLPTDWHRLPTDRHRRIIQPKNVATILFLLSYELRIERASEPHRARGFSEQFGANKRATSC